MSCGNTTCFFFWLFLLLLQPFVIIAIILVATELGQIKILSGLIVPILCICGMGLMVRRYRGAPTRFHNSATVKVQKDRQLECQDGQDSKGLQEGREEIV